MNNKTLPHYSIQELNTAINNLLERGFAPRFSLDALVSKPQIKKGHLWLTLTDGNATISGVVWSSKLKQISYCPEDGDGVLIIGKLNFWTSRAILNVQILDIRPNLKTVLRQFEIVKDRLQKDGLIAEERKKAIPKYPKAIAILTSVPSSALADMLRTASERWPMTKLFIIPIPVQGNASRKIKLSLNKLAREHKKLEIDTVILARGGGNREDLIVFDDEEVCREIAAFPIPVITGIGHEDDLTVADLVADFRAATPTGAIIAAMPNKEAAKIELKQLTQRLEENYQWILKKEQHRLMNLKIGLERHSPTVLIKKLQLSLERKAFILEALSPEKWVSRGFCIVRNNSGNIIRSVNNVALEQDLTIQISDGEITSKVSSTNPNS